MYLNFKTKNNNAHIMFGKFKIIQGRILEGLGFKLNIYFFNSRTNKNFTFSIRLPLYTQIYIHTTI